MATFLKDNNITYKCEDSKELKMLNSMLEKHIHALAFNVASIASVMGLINNNEINNAIIHNLHNYIETSCSKSNKKKGGSMPSDYYGYENSRYTEGNYNTGANTETVDFNSGVQRAGIDSQLGMSGGGNAAGGAKHLYDSSIKTQVKDIIKRNNVKISKDTMQKLLNIINDNLHCLLISLKKHEAITVTKLEKMMKMKKFAVFN